MTKYCYGQSYSSGGDQANIHNTSAFFFTRIMLTVA